MGVWSISISKWLWCLNSWALCLRTGEEMHKNKSMFRMVEREEMRKIQFVFLCFFLEGGWGIICSKGKKIFSASNLFLQVCSLNNPYLLVKFGASQRNSIIICSSISPYSNVMMNSYFVCLQTWSYIARDYWFGKPCTSCICALVGWSAGIRC